MRKILLFLCFIIVALSSKSQTIDGRTYTPFNNYYKWRGGAFDSTLLLPTVTASIGRRPGALRYNTADSSVYSWTGTQWRKVGASTDTSSLSNRINLKLNLSDTASMLLNYRHWTQGYLKSADITGKLNISDTSTMLSTYLRSNTAAATYATIAQNNAKVNISDTTAMLSPYLRSNIASATYATISQNNAKVNITDTATMLSPYLRSNVANATYQLQLDTVPLAVFGAGSGAAGDTLAFSTSAVYGSFYNAGSDTLIITQMRAGVLGTSPSITTEVYWNDSLNITAGATILVSGGTSVTGTIGATNVTSFTNNKIPPNVWVFVRTSAVATKPTYFTLTLLGYKKRI
jgi:hypothetical protein